MVYLSAVIQRLAHPINIYDLVLRHRQSLFLFGLAADILLILRFGLAGFLFSVFYESTKFYIFGDRFLAEAFIIYPFVYLLGIAINKFTKQKIYKGEFIISAILTWFIFIMREPYIPAVIFIYIVLIWNKNFLREKIISIFIFLSLLVLSLPLLNLRNYIYDVFFVSSKAIASVEINREKLFPFGILKSFFYPIYILAGGEKTFMRIILVSFSFIFFYANFIYYYLRKKLKPIIFIFIVLGLSNLRIVTPGYMFYSSFHMLPWYAMFLIVPFMLLQNLNSRNKIAFYLVFLALLPLFIFITTSKNSFIKEKIDPYPEFISNYGHLNQTGELIKALSEKNNSFFADGFDESLYPQTNLISPYKYSMYTSVMPLFDKFADDRLEMFQKNPPDFYYGTCPRDENSTRILPDSARPLYQQLKEFGKPSCLFLLKTILPNIRETQWTKAKALGFEKPF